ncbi:hypothetical protein FACS189472_18640 [Alphaproteobacteria bacterium]|nr:hypothetical protein FACS189472_18640 [Alphaproteobacteria bacterium]
MSKVINKLLCSVLTAGAMIGAVGNAAAINKVPGAKHAGAKDKNSQIEAPVTPKLVASGKTSPVKPATPVALSVLAKFFELLKNHARGKIAYATLKKYPVYRNTFCALVSDRSFRSALADVEKVDANGLQAALNACDDDTASASYAVLKKNPASLDASLVLLNIPGVRKALAHSVLEPHTAYNMKYPQVLGAIAYLENKAGVGNPDELGPKAAGILKYEAEKKAKDGAKPHLMQKTKDRKHANTVKQAHAKKIAKAGNNGNARKKGKAIGKTTTIKK